MAEKRAVAAIALPDRFESVTVTWSQWFDWPLWPTEGTRTIGINALRAVGVAPKRVDFFGSAAASLRKHSDSSSRLHLA